jgi:hypothetical protein
LLLLLQLLTTTWSKLLLRKHLLVLVVVLPAFLLSRMTSSVDAQVLDLGIDLQIDGRVVNLLQRLLADLRVIVYPSTLHNLFANPLV